VTLRGAPGIGKTTLATAAARYLHERRHFKDGVFFVSLRDAASAEKVRTLLADAAGVPATKDAELFAGLRDKQILFVLDNAEDVLAAPGSGIQAFLDNLLGHAGRVKLLVTSRHAIGGGVTRAAENVLPLTRLADQDAKTLFRRLADAARSRPLTDAEANGSDVAEILRLLGGNPHALRLAAPRLETWSLARLRQELDAAPMDVLRVADVPPDELDSVRSLERSLSVSVGYIRSASPEAVRLFGVMGLLPGGAFNKDLDVIWGDGWHSPMDTLIRASLVEHANVAGREYWFTFPFVTRYAKTHLTPDEHTRFATNASKYFEQLSEWLYELMSSNSGRTARLLFSFEEDNLWACLDTERPIDRTGVDDLTPPGRIATHLSQMLLTENRVQDGLRATERGREVCRVNNDVLGEASCLRSSGDLLFRAGNLTMARQALEGALVTFQSRKQRLSEADTLRELGRLASREGNLALARQRHEKALSLFKQIKNNRGIANTLYDLGGLSLKEGDSAAAESYYSEALPIYHTLDDRLGTANCYRGKGNAYSIAGNPEEALKQLNLAIQIHEFLGDMLSVGADLGYVARAAKSMNKVKESVLLSENAISIFVNIEDHWSHTLSLVDQADSFLKLGLSLAGYAAMYRARTISRITNQTTIRQLDEFFTQGAAGNEGMDWAGLMDNLEANGEALRQEGVAAVVASLGAEDRHFLAEFGVKLPPVAD